VWQLFLSAGAAVGSPTPEWYNNRRFPGGAPAPAPGALARQSGTLFVVATPIGNLEDITLRALRVLREADLIAAEDTRRTARLLAAHTVSTPTLSFHAHNARARLPRLLDRLRAGDDVALVTDAGTPGVSDPGVELVRACIEAGIAVDPVPGVSAPLAALVASGFPMDHVTLLGFPPTRSKDRISWLKDLENLPATVTFFEAPHRIKRTLADAATVLVDRPIMVGRELTKVHQEFLRGTCSSVLARISEPRGEFTVVVGPPVDTGSTPAEVPEDSDLAAEFYRLTKTDKALSRRAAVSTVAKTFGCSSRQVYAAIERAKEAPSAP